MNGSFKNGVLGSQNVDSKSNQVGFFSRFISRNWLLVSTLVVAGGAGWIIGLSQCPLS